MKWLPLGKVRVRLVAAFSSGRSFSVRAGVGARKGASQEDCMMPSAVGAGDAAAAAGAFAPNAPLMMPRSSANSCGSSMAPFTWWDPAAPGELEAHKANEL